MATTSMLTWAAMAARTATGKVSKIRLHEWVIGALLGLSVPWALSWSTHAYEQVVMDRFCRQYHFDGAALAQDACIIHHPPIYFGLMDEPCTITLMGYSSAAGYELEALNLQNYKRSQHMIDSPYQQAPGLNLTPTSAK